MIITIELPCPQPAEVHNRLVDTLGLQVGLSILNIVDQLSIGWLINNSLDGPYEMMITHIGGRFPTDRPSWQMQTRQG